MRVLDEDYGSPGPPFQDIPMRIEQMIAILLAHQDEICKHPYGHIELHYKDEQVQASMKHPLSLG